MDVWNRAMDKPADSDVIEVNELLEEQTLENEKTEKLGNQVKYIFTTIRFFNI